MIKTNIAFFTDAGQEPSPTFKLDVYSGGPEGHFFINVIDTNSGKIIDDVTKDTWVNPDMAVDLLVDLAEIYKVEAIDGLRIPEVTPTMMPGELAIVRGLRKRGLVETPQITSGESLGIGQRR